MKEGDDEGDDEGGITEVGLARYSCMQFAWLPRGQIEFLVILAFK